MTTFERYAIKPAVIGTTGFLLSKSVIPSIVDQSWSRTFSFDPSSMLGRLSGTQSIGVPILAGLAVAGGSIFAEILHDAIFPHIHWLEKSSEKATLLTAGAANGAGLAGVLYLGNDKAIGQLGLPTIIGVGMASEILGNEIYSRFVKGTYEGFVEDI